MRKEQIGLLAWGLVIGVAAGPMAAMAQTGAPDELMSLDSNLLRDEIGKRYDAALAATQDNGVVSADDSRYIWASQAKAQCGIALGFLKSGTKDPVSIGKCADAYERMRIQPPSAPVQPVAAALPESCSQPLAGIVFFDWDSAVPPVSALQTLDSILNSQRLCNWTGLVVTGHTDRSGSDRYNEALSVRRANAIADLLESRGMARSVLEVSGRGEAEPKVPTIDGERNPSNRRVEVTVK